MTTISFIENRKGHIRNEIRRLNNEYCKLEEEEARILKEVIGKWEEQLGYRGMYDVWKHQKTKSTLIIAKSTLIIGGYEDCELKHECECEEVWVHDDSGNADILGVFNTYKRAKIEAKKWMRENRDGMI